MMLRIIARDVPRVHLRPRKRRKTTKRMVLYTLPSLVLRALSSHGGEYQRMEKVYIVLNTIRKRDVEQPSLRKTLHKAGGAQSLSSLQQALPFTI